MSKTIQTIASRDQIFLVSTLRIQVENLPPEFHGFRMVHLTDFHYGPSTTAAHLRALVRAANRLKPDAIFLTGDFIHYSITGFQHLMASRLNTFGFRWLDYRRKTRRLIEGIADILVDLEAPEGIYGTLGNHDHIEGAGSVLRLLPEEIVWLQNTSATITRGSRSVVIAGVDDVNRGKPDLRRALTAPQDNDTAPPCFQVLLSHNPDITLDQRASLIETVDLLLCGHTHGGQICLPVIGPLTTRTRQKQHVRGLSRIRDTLVYTSSGVGYGMVPLRTLCPPEIVEIELLPAFEKTA